MLTNSVPSAAYFSGVEARAKMVSFISSAARVIAAGSVMKEPSSGTTASVVKKKAMVRGSGITRTMACTATEAACSTGRLPATTMIANTNSGSVKLRLSR